MDVDTPHRQPYMLTFAALATGTLAFVVLQSMVLPALPAIEHQLHVSEDAATWTLTAYLLSASVATPVLGRMGDIHGKERLLVIVLAALALGTLISALSTSLLLLVVGRLIQGLAGAIFPLSFSIIRDEFPRDRIPTGHRNDLHAHGDRQRSRASCSAGSSSSTCRSSGCSGYRFRPWSSPWARRSGSCRSPRSAARAGSMSWAASSWPDGCSPCCWP